MTWKPMHTSKVRVSAKRISIFILNLSSICPIVQKLHLNQGILEETCITNEEAIEEYTWALFQKGLRLIISLFSGWFYGRSNVKLILSLYETGNTKTNTWTFIEPFINIKALHTNIAPIESNNMSTRQFSRCSMPDAILEKCNCLIAL